MSEDRQGRAQQMQFRLIYTDRRGVKAAEFRKRWELQKGK